MRAAFEKVATDGSQFFLLKRRLDPLFEFNWHYHPEIELTFIAKSRGRRLVGDNIADYEDGDLVLIGPNLPHTWSSFPSPAGTTHDAVVVQFGENLLGPGNLDALKLGPVRSLLDRSSRGIAFRGKTRRDVAARMLRLERLPALLALAELLVILDLLARAREYELLSSAPFAPPSRRDASHPIDQVCTFINERFSERIPLGAAARVIGMSPSAFCRFFRRATHRTFTGYVNELRIGHACRLLMNTERGIADIAGASGFLNLSNFNRCFLRLKKMRPSDFRRECRRYRAMPAA